jgi:hypothetical protein
MAELIDKPMKRANLKRPAIVLAISVGISVVGSVVCFPGICGCASWLGLENPDRFGWPFAILTVLGELGAIVSILWLGVNLLRRALSRNR